MLVELWLPQSCGARSDRETEAHAGRRSKVLQIFLLDSSKGQLDPIVGQRGTCALLICGNDDADSVQSFHGDTPQSIVVLVMK